MKTKSGLGVLVTLILLAGCVPSLNPIFSDDSLTFDPAMLGTWTQPHGQGSWELMRRDSKSYRLVSTDKRGQQGRFIARLAEVQGTLFLDLFPESVGSEFSDLHKLHLVPIHTIYLVQRQGTDLQLLAIDYKRLDNLLTQHPDAIQYSTFDGKKLITAPTSDVQQFLVEHKEMFTNRISLERQTTP